MDIMFNSHIVKRQEYVQSARLESWPRPGRADWHGPRARLLDLGRGLPGFANYVLIYHRIIYYDVS